MTISWQIRIAVHNIVHIPAEVCVASAPAAVAVTSTCNAAAVLPRPRRTFVVELHARHALTACAAPPPTAVFTLADVSESAPGVYEATLDGSDCSGGSDSDAHAGRTREKARRQRRNRTTHTQLWRCTAPSVEVYVVVKQLVHDKSNNSDDKNATDDDNSHDGYDDGEGSHSDGGVSAIAADHAMLPRTSARTTATAASTATRSSSFTLLAQSTYVTVPVRHILQRDKLRTWFVATCMGFVGVSCRVDAADRAGYTARLRAFLARHHPAALRLVGQVVETVPERQTFLRLYRSYGVCNDVEGRVYELVAYYDDNIHNDVANNQSSATVSAHATAAVRLRAVATLLTQWRGRELDLLHRLVLDNGPEPRDVDVCARVRAFVARYGGVMCGVDAVDVQRVLSLAAAASSSPGTPSTPPLSSPREACAAPRPSALLLLPPPNECGEDGGVQEIVSTLFARWRARYGPEPHPFTYLQPPLRDRCDCAVQRQQQLPLQRQCCLADDATDDKKNNNISDNDEARVATASSVQRTRCRHVRRAHSRSCSSPGGNNDSSNNRTSSSGSHARRCTQRQKKQEQQAPQHHTRHRSPSPLPRAQPPQPEPPSTHAAAQHAATPSRASPSASLSSPSPIRVVDITCTRTNKNSSSDSSSDSTIISSTAQQKQQQQEQQERARDAVVALQGGVRALHHGDVCRRRQQWPQCVCTARGADSVHGLLARAYVAELAETDYAGAVQWYTRYVQHMPHDATALYRCALLLDAALGKRDAARQMYERAAALGHAAAAARVEQLTASALRACAHTHATQLWSL